MILYTMNPSEPLSLGIFNSNTSLSSYNFFSFHLLVNILIFLLSSNRTAVHSWTIYILCPLTNFSQSCVCVCVCACASWCMCTHTHTHGRAVGCWCSEVFPQIHILYHLPQENRSVFLLPTSLSVLVLVPNSECSASATDISVSHWQSEFLRAGHIVNHNI